MSRNQFSSSVGQIGWRVLWIQHVCFTPYWRNVSKLRMPFKLEGRLLGGCEGLKLMHTVTHKGVFILHFPLWPLSLSGLVQKIGQRICSHSSNSITKHLCVYLCGRGSFVSENHFHACRQISHLPFFFFFFVKLNDQIAHLESSSHESLHSHRMMNQTRSVSWKEHEKPTHTGLNGDIK